MLDRKPSADLSDVAAEIEHAAKELHDLASSVRHAEYTGQSLWFIARTAGVRVIRIAEETRQAVNEIARGLI